MCKYTKIFLLCLLNSSFLYSMASSGACEEGFEKTGQERILNDPKYDLSVSEINRLVNHLENNVFLVLQRATTNQDVTVRLKALEGINNLGVQLVHLVERGLNHSDVEVRREALRVPFKLLYNIIMININKLNDPRTEVQNQIRQNAASLLKILLPLMDRVLGMQDEKMDQSVTALRAHILSLQKWVGFQSSINLIIDTIPKEKI